MFLMVAGFAFAFMVVSFGLEGDVFQHPLKSGMTTLTMMLGEFNFGDLYQAFGRQSSSWWCWPLAILWQGLDQQRLCHVPAAGDDHPGHDHHRQPLCRRHHLRPVRLANRGTWPPTALINACSKENCSTFKLHLNPFTRCSTRTWWTWRPPPSLLKRFCQILLSEDIARLVASNWFGSNWLQKVIRCLNLARLTTRGLYVDTHCVRLPSVQVTLC